MASSSPYQNNDYQALSTFRPYRLPINDIFKANAAIDAYWDRGAERVKQAYDNVLDLKLKTTDNRTIRDQFVKDSEKQITKLSSMNLADPSVQNQGRNIFSPIMKDQDIVGEDFVVRNNESELGVAEGYRTKDSGKGYNPMSVENLQFEGNLLSTDPSRGGLNKRDGWRSLANTQSKYTPYTDITKEYTTISNAVKAKEIEDAQLRGDDWYIETIKKKGVSKDRMLEAIQEMGSPQLKSQIGVEARNVFYKKLSGDPTSVDQYYQHLAQSYYSTKINELKSQQSEYDYDAAMTPSDSKDPETRKANQQRILSAQQASKQLGQTINQLITKDMPEYIATMRGLGNPTNLSSSIPKIEQLWQQSSLDNIAGALAYESTSHDIKSNPSKIAQENLSLGYQRLNQDWAQLGETKRHNQTEETLRALEIVGKGKKNADGSSIDPDVENPFAGSSSTMNTSLPTDPVNAASQQELADKFLEYAKNSDEPIREMSIRSLIGDNGWSRVQENIASDKPIGEALLPDEVNQATTVMSAFYKKHPEAFPLSSIGNAMGVNMTPTDFTDEQFKQFIGSLPVGQFKSVMGSMVKADPDFMSDLVRKGGEENGTGIQKVAKFRADYNKALTKQINLSSNINTKISKNLAEYAQYFPDNGKVLMTDQAIENAYNKGMSTRQLKAYTIQTIVPGTGASAARSGGETISVPITKAEYDALTPEQKIDKGAAVLYPSLDEFKNEVKRRTNFVYAKAVTESNQIMYPYTYDSKDKEATISDVNRFANSIAYNASTDAKPDIDKLIQFIVKNPEHVKARMIIPPGIGQQLPSVKFQMEGGFGKKDDGTEEMVDKINKASFPVTGLAPKFYAKSDEDGYIRNPGSVIVHAPFKSSTPGGYVEIVNYSNSPATIEPRIAIKGGDMMLRYIDAKGNKRVRPEPITARELEQQFSIANNGQTIAQVVQRQGGIDAVHTWIAGFINNLDAQYSKTK